MQEQRQEQSERLSQKLEDMALDPDLGPCFIGVIYDVMQTRVLDGQSTIEQYVRVSRAFNPDLTPDELDQGVANLQDLLNRFRPPFQE